MRPCNMLMIDKSKRSSATSKHSHAPNRSLSGPHPLLDQGTEPASTNSCGKGTPLPRLKWHKELMNFALPNTISWPMNRKLNYKLHKRLNN
jgi:hypothetical protein